MRKNYPYVPLFLIFIFIVGCEKEEEDFPEVNKTTTKYFETASKDEVFKHLRSNHTKSSENIEIFYSEMRQEDLINSNEKITVIPAETKHKNHFSRVLLMKIEGEIHSVVYSKYGIVGEEENDFSGEIVITTLDGKFINGFSVRNGLAVSRLVLNKNKLQKTSQTCEIHSNGDAECWLQGDLDEVIVTAPKKSEPILLKEMYPPDEDGGGDSPEWDGGSTGGGGGSDTSSTPTVEEDKIDASELDDKAECIYNRLNVSSSTFKKIIQNFDGDFPVSHLKFSINNLLPSGNYGITNPPENYWIEIEMSNTQLGEISDLGSATAFVHEIVHAEIYRKMLAAAQMGDLDPENMTSQQQVDYVNSLRNDFPGIYDYYIDRYRPTWNHNMMAEHYIDAIADAIQQFDNFTQDRQVYEDIAWAGLRKLEDGTTSTAWNSLSDLEKQRILKSLSDYFFNGPSNCN